MPGVFLVWVEAPDIASSAQPGQFITVDCASLTLRRPLSIHQVLPSPARDSTEGRIALLFKVVGEGTLWMSQRQKDDKIDVLGASGKGFNIEPGSRNLLLVAGGIGIAPLVFLAQQASLQHSVTLIHGASTAAQLYPLSALPEEVRFIPITEDGTAGEKGMVTDILPDFLDWAYQVYACGPIDMYKAIAEMSSRVNKGKLKIKKCQLSLEVRMGCGIGACYSCTISTKRGLKQVCRDGPVFELDDILWDEVRL